MGLWANQGRKTFKKGKMDDDYNVYRQSYFNANLPSLKKYLVYLANDNGETYRYMFLPYVFTEGETAVHIQSHGNSKRSSSRKEYKQTMPSTMEAIREGKGIPREIMHAIIDDRGGIDNVRSSGEYLRDRGQIYHAPSKSNNRSDNSSSSTDPLVELLQISKSQQRGNKEHWFVRDVNFSNEQTVFLANDQQLLDVQRFCTNPELFSVFLANATFNVANHYFTFGTYRNLILETQQGTNPICIGPGVLHKRKLEESYYTLPSLMVKCNFLPYFVKGLADVMKDSMRADIRSMCGLGFPPTTYSQNASECLNRYVKENAKGSEDVTSSLVEVVKNISDVQTIKPTAFVHLVLLSLSKTKRLTIL